MSEGLLDSTAANRDRRSDGRRGPETRAERSAKRETFAQRVTEPPQSSERSKILYCSKRAFHTGVRPGMSIAEARAIDRFLSVHDDDPEADRHVLEKLAAWAERYSPIVGLEEGPAPQCLFLDVTGCAAYFHGEDRLAQHALEALSERGWIVRIAIADTIGAAWGLAHQNSDLRSAIVVPSGETEKATLLLPVAALRLPEDVLAKLAELGIQNIGQLQQLPRSEVPGRFGPLVLQRLDQMLGSVPELLVPCRAAPPVQARCRFEYPTDRREFVDHAVDRLLERIVHILREQHRGAKHLECRLYQESSSLQGAAGKGVCVEVRLFRPSRSPAHLKKLLQARLDKIRLAEPVAGICLRVPVVEIMSDRQYELFDAEQPRSEDLAALIDRLVSRLGREAVTFPLLVPDPQPEYACRFEPAIAADTERKRKNKKQAPAPALASAPALDIQLFFHRPVQVWPVPRPIEILARDGNGLPSRFRCRNAEYGIDRAWGPERIETGWWRGSDIHRDYYIVETECGIRWWIFRSEDDRWCLHGCFD